MVYIENLISIIIPVFKVEKYLSRCIDSILYQTYKNFEIILVDDASPDNCPEICDNYANDFNNIFVIHLKDTGAGPADARNAGIKFAKGKFVTFIDSDDFVHRELLMVLKNAILENQTLMAMCFYKKIYNSFDVINHSLINNTVSVIRDSECMNLLFEDQALSACWGKLYDISLFENIFYPSGKCNEDMFITPLIINKSKKIAVIRNFLYYYCQDAPSLVRAKFSYPKLDLIDATYFWATHTKLYYPELSEKGYIHYFNSMITSCQFISNKIDDFGKSKYLSYKIELLNNFYYIFNSKYTSKNNKIKIILLKFGLFRIIFKYIELFKIKKYDIGF